MNKMNDLEVNLQNLVETKVVNLEVTLASLVKGGAIAGLDPWDIWCGNGWILRRGPTPGPRPIGLAELEGIREMIRHEVREQIAR